jgi:hypothetical protein
LPEVKQLPEAFAAYVSTINMEDIRKRPRLLSLLFCDFYNQTSDGKVNLIGIFDRIFVHPEIKKTPAFFLYVRTAETFEDLVSVRIFGPEPENEPIAELNFGGPKEMPSKDRLPGDPNQLQLLMPIAFEVKKQGVFWFDVSFKGKSLGGAGLVMHYRETEDKQSGTDGYV